jgi:hypothetical protein
MSNKKQTAVEWLIGKIDEELIHKSMGQVYKQAKEMEKQQIIDAVVWFDDTDRTPSQIEIDAQQYYEENYKP